MIWYGIFPTFSEIEVCISLPTLSVSISLNKKLVLVFDFSVFWLAVKVSSVFSLKYLVSNSDKEPDLPLLTSFS